MGGLRFGNSMISSVYKNLYGIRSVSKTSHMLIISTTLPTVKVSLVSKNLARLGNAHRLHNPLFGTRNYSVYRCISHICQPLFKCLSCVTFFTGRFETVPYINKTLYVFPFIDKICGELCLMSVKKDWEWWLILPQDHPECVKIEAIAQKILKALQRETGVRHVLADHQWLKEEGGGVKLVKKSRSKENGKSTSAYLMEGIEWEFFVLDSPYISARAINIGKIFIWRGTLARCKTDAELAIIIATMVGHVIARHAQRCLAWFPLKIYHRVVNGYDPFLIYVLSHKYEADHIGLLLFASAGYDPRIAPKVLEQAIEDCQNAGGDELSEFIMYRRLKFMTQPTLMQDAITIYEESMKKGHVAD